MPRRALIGPGFALIAVGLLLMRGLTAQSHWTHLLPGMIVAGVGAGLVNVPLVSTAVGVVEPARAGMASGINNTLRQVGIATGVAALGTILAAHLGSGFAAGLNVILLVGAVIAVVAAVASLLLIRERDFVTGEEAGVPAIKPAEPTLSIPD